ncbi:hypothetical protein [uncultured Mediterranean phage]|nr:hypothetical protein [uncultured Mediterranean phage]
MKNVSLTVSHWQFLLERASQFMLPEKMGKGEEFDVAIQSIAADEVKCLVEHLKPYSGWLQGWGDDKFVIFGSKDEVDIKYKENTKEFKSFKFHDASKVYKIKLSDDARNGAAWILYMAMHPVIMKKGQGGEEQLYHRPVGAITQSDICWPVAKAIGRADALKSYLKIDKTKARQWPEDKVEEEEIEEGTPTLALVEDQNAE